MKFLILLLSSAFALHCGIASAQNSLGEILDQGAKKLSPEELKALFSGATVSGTLASGARFSTKYAPDGTHAGILETANFQTGMQGTWKIDGSGKLCTDTRFNSPYVPPASNCNFWFKAADRYFFSASDSDRGSRVEQRNLAR